jgi:FlaA1/EpsC-like NDP-sugar epimerase
MILFKNRYISTYRIIFFAVDTALLLGAVPLGYYLWFMGKEFYVTLQELSIRSFFFTFVLQLSLYYFELYDLKIIRDHSKSGYRLIQSMAVAVILLMIAYYAFPLLTVGRGALLLSISLATIGIFFWRIIYRSMVRGNQLKERIMILGTGDFAKEIARQIRDKRDSGFEVIGHIDEDRKEGKT